MFFSCDSFTCYCGKSPLNIFGTFLEANLCFAPSRVKPGNLSLVAESGNYLDPVGSMYGTFAHVLVDFDGGCR